MEQPDSPLLAVGFALALGCIAYLSHRALCMLRSGNLLDHTVPEMRSYWPFRSREQAQMVQGTFLELLLLGFKWILGFAAILLAIYPIIFLLNLGGI
jgi:hypothetical protein